MSDFKRPGPLTVSEQGRGRNGRGPRHNLHGAELKVQPTRKRSVGMSGTCTGPIVVCLGSREGYKVKKDT